MKSHSLSSYNILCGVSGAMSVADVHGEGGPVPLLKTCPGGPRHILRLNNSSALQVYQLCESTTANQIFLTIHTTSGSPIY